MTCINLLQNFKGATQSLLEPSGSNQLMGETSQLYQMSGQIHHRRNSSKNDSPFKNGRMRSSSTSHPADRKGEIYY